MGAAEAAGNAAQGLAGAALLALPAWAVYRAGHTADGHYHRLRTLQTYRKKDLSIPMPDLTVKESYERFAAQKTAAGRGDPLREAFFSQTLPRELITSGAAGLGRGFGEVVGDVFVRTPANELGKLLKKKLVSEPKQRDAYMAAIQGDDTFTDKSPEELARAHSTLVRLAPGLAEDPNFVKTYMRSAVASGGLPDLPTMQLLLNAQKTFLQAKGKNVGP